MRLSDEQIKATIRNMRASTEVKEKLERAALANDERARFSVYGLFLRQRRQNPTN